MTRSIGPLRWQMLASHVPAQGQGGGMVRYVVEMAAALDRRNDVELSVLTSAEAGPFFTDLLSSFDRVHTLPRLPTVGRSVLERYTNRSQAGGPFDVVHGTKHLLPRRSAAVRVLTVHDMVLQDRPQDFGLVKRVLLRSPYQASLADADAVVCVSEATRARLSVRAPGLGAHCVVVPLAVSGALLHVVPHSVPTLEGKRFAIVVGDASFRKNLSLVVDCWDRVCEQVPDAVLAIAGPPSWAGSSHGESFDRLVGQGRVVALGRVPDAELRWCYENAAVALCPSVLEGFGLPAVEALAFGTPLITSTDPALCEVSGELAQHVPADRPDLWVTAISTAVASGRSSAVPYTPRTWDEVAHDTVSAVRPIVAKSRDARSLSP